MKVKVSILVPTTFDRGALLPYSVGSILRQSVKDLEVLIVGDGVTKETVETIKSIERQDPRIRFFSFPKGKRRGEKKRDEVLLNEAQGDVICYLCDRDLMLPNHVECVLEHIESGANFVATGVISSSPDGTLVFNYEKPSKYFSETRIDRLPKRKRHSNFQLSSVGHSMQIYRKLGERWSTTPRSERYTDVYMWKKFLDHEDCRAIYTAEPTILYFKRGSHPGWPTEKRLPEIRQYAEKLQSDTSRSRLHTQVLISLADKALEMKSAPVLIRGVRLSKFPSQLLTHLRWRIQNLP